MKNPVDRFGTFLEGYREQERKQKEGQATPPRIQALDILDLFARKKVSHLTSFEISSELMGAPQEVARLVEELVQRDLVSVEPQPGREKGNDLVVLTRRGKTFTGSLENR